MWAAKGLSMEKWLCWGSMGTSGFLLLLFLLDIVLGVVAETEREATLRDILRPAADASSLALAIGPEGGWTHDELSSFQGSQWIAASLGVTISLISRAPTRRDI